MNASTLIKGLLSEVNGARCPACGTWNKFTEEPGAAAASDCPGCGYSWDDDGDDEDPEAAFEKELSSLLTGAGHRCSTFKDDGVLTSNKGLVVTTGRNTFQITIVKSRSR